MRRHRPDVDAAVGEDSFLDTTANLVGILIILVVVIGTKTKIDAEEYGRKLAEEESHPQLEQPARQASALLASLGDQKQTLREFDLESEYRKLERDMLLEQVVGARAKVEEKLAATGDEQREAVQSTQDIERLESQLKQVEQQLGAAAEHKRPKIALEHLPTPMAKTVFSREMHIQLRQGQVTVIPWDRLVDTLKQQIPLAARRAASRNLIEDKIGPIGGFVMDYRMVAVPGGFELERFELEPIDSVQSESLEEALSSNGRLRSELASRDPRETVVTVWVYPDSFEEFRVLKARLFEAGFLSAARPLPAGIRIGASPSGTRSSAQ